MKKYFTVLISLILVMALIPVVVSGKTFMKFFSNNSKQAVSNSIISTGKDSGYNMPDNLTFTDTSTQKQMSRSAKQIIYSLVGAAVEKDFEENEVKALAIALHTQLCRENDLQTLALDTKNTNIFLNKNDLKQKFGNNYTTLCSYCDNVYTALILSSGKPANLNIEYLSDSQKTNDTITLKANPYNSLSRDYSTAISFGKEDFFKALKEINPDINTDIAPQSAVGEITYYESGEVDTVNICDTEFSGSDLSAAFSLPYRRFTLIYSLDQFQFTSIRCDVSNKLTPNIAKFMALQGNTYPEILNYCYSP